MIWVLNWQNVIAETRNHKQLLIQWIHVADAAKIFDSNTACGAFLVFVEPDVPVWFLISPPTWVLVEFLHIVQNDKQVVYAISCQCLQEDESLTTICRTFTFGCIFGAVWDLKETVMDDKSGHKLAHLLFKVRETLQNDDQNIHETV